MGNNTNFQTSEAIRQEITLLEMKAIQAEGKASEIPQGDIRKSFFLSEAKNARVKVADLNRELKRRYFSALKLPKTQSSAALMAGVCHD